MNDSCLDKGIDIIIACIDEVFEVSKEIKYDLFSFWWSIDSLSFAVTDDGSW